VSVGVVVPVVAGHRGGDGGAVVEAVRPLN